MEKLYASEQGSGDPVLLIHGFPMTSLVWKDLSGHLANTFRVITVDLPGFGKSALPDTPFSLDDIAAAVLAFIEARGLQNIVVIGHSMGGYVTMAMAEQKPEWLAGIGLFHSTAFGDSEEKKVSRTRTIEFIEKNGAEAFTSNFISPLFANPQHPGVNRIRMINMQADAPVLTGYTRAMRDRPDRRHVLKEFQKPVLFISGARDPGITPASVAEQARIAPRAFIHLLQEQAHMALIEDADTAAALVADFATECYRGKT